MKYQFGCEALYTHSIRFLVPQKLCGQLAGDML